MVDFFFSVRERLCPPEFFCRAFESRMLLFNEITFTFSRKKKLHRVRVQVFMRLFIHILLDKIAEPPRKKKRFPSCVDEPAKPAKDSQISIYSKFAKSVHSHRILHSLGRACAGLCLGVSRRACAAPIPPPKNDLALCQCRAIWARAARPRHRPPTRGGQVA